MAIKSTSKKPTVTTVQLQSMPGHAIRRLHQIAVGVFHQQVSAMNVTPVQYSVLQTICNHPEIDQSTLASHVALDTSTTAGVVDRLEARNLVTRTVSPQDKRVRLLTLTPEGDALLKQVIPGMLRSQELILAPLNAKQRTEFLQLLQVLVTENNALSRAPHEATRTSST